MSENENEPKAPRWPWLLVLLAGCVFVASVYLTVRDYRATRKATDWHDVQSWQDAAWRGDFFGGYAGMSGFAGTLMLFTAFLLQRDELHLQRKELRANRTVAEQQANALDKQADALKAQVHELERQRNELEEQTKIARLRDDRALILELSARLDREPLSRTLRDRILRHSFEFILERATVDFTTGTELFELFVGTTDWPELDQMLGPLDVMLRQGTERSRKWIPHLRASVLKQFDESVWKSCFKVSDLWYGKYRAESIETST